MADVGQGERLHVISEHVCVMCVSVNRVDTGDCAKLLEWSLLRKLGYFP